MAQLLPWLLTVVAAGVALVALIAAWLFSVEVRQAWGALRATGGSALRVEQETVPRRCLGVER